MAEGEHAKGLVGDVISVLRSTAPRASCFGGKMSQAATNLPEYTVTRFGRERPESLLGLVDVEHLTGDESETRGPVSPSRQNRGSKVRPGYAGEPWPRELWSCPLPLPVVRRQKWEERPLECLFLGVSPHRESLPWLNK